MADPEDEIENHPAWEYLDQFEPGFSAWVGHLYRLLFMRKAGYPFKEDDLTIEEWQCLFILEHYRKGEGHDEKQKSEASD